MRKRTNNLSNGVKELSDKFFGESKDKALITTVDEKYPYGSTYDNGFPKMQYQVYNPEGTIKKYYDIGFYLREFNEKKVLNEIREIVTTSNT